MCLEGTWPVTGGASAVGQCRITARGLYWLIDCRITEGWEGVSRLVLLHGGGAVNLGIPVPEGAFLRLTRSIPRKHLEEVQGEPSILLLPAHAPLPQRPEAAPPEDSLQEEVPPEDSPQEEVLPEDSPQEEVPPEDDPQEEAPPEDSPQKEVPPEDDPQEEAPPEDSPQEEAPPEDSPQEEVPPEDSLQEEVPPEDSPQEEVPPEDRPQEEVPPEDEQTEIADPEKVPYIPGEPLPHPEDWPRLRAEPDGQGGLFLSWEEQTAEENGPKYS